MGNYAHGASAGHEFGTLPHARGRSVPPVTIHAAAD